MATTMAPAFAHLVGSPRDLPGRRLFQAIRGGADGSLINRRFRVAHRTRDKNHLSAVGADAGAAATRGRAVLEATDAAYGSPQPPATKKRRTKRAVHTIKRSFSFPLAEYHALIALKTRLAQLSLPVKKGELLRVGIALLASLSDDELQAVVERVPLAKKRQPRAKPRS